MSVNTVNGIKITRDVKYFKFSEGAFMEIINPFNSRF